MPGSSGKEQGIPPAQAKPDADKCISAESHKRQTASSGTDTESGMFSVFVFLFYSERAVYESKALRVDAYLREEESCRKGGTMKLLKVDTLAQARERLLEAAKECLPETEQIALADASDRILAEDIVSGEMIPAFRRSSVDGYAVCSKDTAGATESIPVFLKVLEEVEIGHPAVSKIEPGTCAYVPTGGMVPEGADAMVMVEYSERFGTDEVALYENVPYGKCIVLPGEDVKTGDIVLKAGTRIGPAQAGTLAALGVVQVPVFKPWKVAVLSTGDELVRIDQVPGPGQVRDINTWALSCYVKKTGLELVLEEVLLEEKIREAVKACDLILISGGSSQGKKDMTMEILNRISKEGVFTHGLALKPGKPTILGYDKEKNTLLGGLPGHPAAALAVFNLLFVWLWKQVTGQPDQPPLEAFMTTNLAGAPGKTTCLLVKLQMAPQGLEAEPIFGKSGLISTMAEADGYVLIDMNQEGLKKGERVKVYRF